MRIFLCFQGEQFEISLKLANEMSLIKEMLEECEDEEDDQEIPIMIEERFITKEGLQLFLNTVETETYLNGLNQIKNKKGIQDSFAAWLKLTDYLDVKKLIQPLREFCLANCHELNVNLEAEGNQIFKDENELLQVKKEFYAHLKPKF